MRTPSDRPRLAVVGSINRDFIIRADVLPSEGETVIGERFHTMHGGKGANQAAAAALVAHPNVEVFMIGAVGAGSGGKDELIALETSYVHVDYVTEIHDVPTGTAFVIVDHRGSNQIVVVPGANRCLIPAHVEQALKRIRPDAVLISLEINLDAVATAVSTGRELGATVILNPAPYQPLSPEIYASVDVLTPNWVEFLQLVGAPPDGGIDPAAIPALLRDADVLQPPSVIIVTLGAQGAALTSDGGVEVYPAESVRVVDTTGAGDAFSGALAAALAAGIPTREAGSLATTVAAGAVGIVGARVPPDAEGLHGLLTARI